MVKEPRPGRVKTRLARDMGTIRAAWWYRHQCRALIARLERGPWRPVLAVSPDTEGLRSRVWPRSVERRPQGTGDLGLRMARIFADFSPAPVLIVGSDIPGIDRSAIERAFGLLRRNDAVIGPSDDGGYWAIGLRGAAMRRPGLFGSVRWSTGHALSDTLAGLGGLRVGWADCLSDVDDLADLEKQKAPPGRGHWQAGSPASRAGWGL